MIAPCNCAAKWANVTCSCSWRAHLTKPTRVEVGWLYDDGTTTRDARLSGLVYPDNEVDGMLLTLEDGEELDVPRADRLGAEGDLREAAFMLWRRAS